MLAQISKTPWKLVNKNQLKTTLFQLYKEGKISKDIILETFGVVRNIEDPSSWKYPHHEWSDEGLILNVNGVLTVKRMVSWGNLTKDEKERLIQHLERHLKEIS